MPEEGADRLKAILNDPEEKAKMLKDFEAQGFSIISIVFPIEETPEVAAIHPEEEREDHAL
jgi:hypothetical protein